MWPLSTPNAANMGLELNISFNRCVASVEASAALESGLSEIH